MAYKTILEKRGTNKSKNRTISLPVYMFWMYYKDLLTVSEMVSMPISSGNFCIVIIFSRNACDQVKLQPRQVRNIVK